jgi:bacterioferritin-associated ferredoxin
MIDVSGGRERNAARSSKKEESMIICQCNGVSDRAIRKAVRDGASSRNDVVRACTAGKACGGCVPAIDEIIDTERERTMRSDLTVLELATG